METLQEKIISLELTKADDPVVEVAINGKSKCADEEEPESDPVTPTTTEERSLGDENTTVVNKKKKRKKSRKGKN